MNSWHVTENPYESLTVDLTVRCNMKCSFCYDADQTRPDIDLAYFEEVCRQLRIPLGKKMLWKFVGGEPTLHPQFFELIEAAHKCGQRVFFSSNGLTIRPGSKFVERLTALPYSVDCGVTLDGGIDHDDIYEALNGQRCAEKKMEGLHTLLTTKHPVYISAIIVRGLNECVIPELLQLAAENRRIAYVHFRTTAKVGRFIDVEPYTAADLAKMMEPHFTEEQRRPYSRFEIWCPASEPKCCIRFMPNPRLCVSLVEFMSPQSTLCPKRGRLVDNFMVEPCFESLMSVSNNKPVRHELAFHGKVSQ